MKILPFPIFATFAFSNVIWFQLGPGAPNFSGAPGPLQS